jgi:hypothetical protein
VVSKESRALALSAVRFSNAGMSCCWRLVQETGGIPEMMWACVDLVGKSGTRKTPRYVFATLAAYVSLFLQVL